ncbi:MAG: DNA polymerase III subunit delta [Sphingomonadaceae bacterium]|nr:DNA polymerase III subunit delta [Sphingomonadaceae bacterium]
MKATQKDFKSIAPRAVREARVFFLCGPDEAGIQDAANLLVSLLPDPGERVEMAGADLRRDPVRLGDEARSTSLFGGNRHIWVRASGDEAHDALATLVSGEAEPCPVLVLAANATDKSRSAKLLAARPDALVAMFYPPDFRDVVSAVRNMADGAGVKLSGDLADRIARAAAMDTRIARAEIEKLALYLDASPQAPRAADAAALEAIGARTEDDGLMPLVNAVLSGQVDRLPRELQRMRELGLNPVGLLLAIERRAAHLAQLAAKVGPRGDIGALIDAEAGARRIFWKDKGDYNVQLRKWRGPRLGRLVDRMMQLHRALLANSQQAELLLAQELTEIAGFIARRK